MNWFRGSQTKFGIQMVRFRDLRKREAQQIFVSFLNLLMRKFKHEIMLCIKSLFHHIVHMPESDIFLWITTRPSAQSLPHKPPAGGNYYCTINSRVAKGKRGPSKHIKSSSCPYYVQQTQRGRRKEFGTKKKNCSSALAQIDTDFLNL